MTTDVSGQPDYYPYGDERMYSLLRRGGHLLEGMTVEQLRGASLALSLLSDHMHDRWFVQRDPFDPRALVRILGELYEMSAERLVHLERGDRQ
jgi:hypothetical protein